MHILCHSLQPEEGWKMATDVNIFCKENRARDEKEGVKPIRFHFFRTCLRDQGRMKQKK
jgi:hypothetical protein